MAGPLTGRLVVAIEPAVAAPACTLRLADAGARVIKIERETGDTARHYDRAVHGTSAYFAWLKRGKESAVLDIKADAARAVVEAVVARADVFVQNLAPGAAARDGLGRPIWWRAILVRSQWIPWATGKTPRPVTCALMIC